jgi:hypothetical protein
MHHVIAYKRKILARRSNAEQGMRRGSGPDYSEMSTILKANGLSQTAKSPLSYCFCGLF